MRPLPLSVFEEYFYRVDSRAYPSRILMRLEFSGRVDRAALEEASRRIVDYHPLLRARVKEGKRGRLYWEFGESRGIPIFWYEGKRDRFKPELKQLDLKTGYTSELHIVSDETGWDIYMTMSHVVIDGLALVELWGDFFKLYARAQGMEVGAPERDERLLESRDRNHMGFWDSVKRWPLRMLGLGLALQLKARIVSPLNADVRIPFESPSSVSDATHVLSTHLSAQDHRELVISAKRKGFALNDLCLGLFQFALGKWRSAHGKGRPDDWIRVGVPVSLKSRSDARMPCCNLIGMVSIDRQGKSLLKRERLLRRAKEDMDYVKWGEFGFAFLSLLQLYRILPGGMAKRIPSNRCELTAIMSNLGKLFLRHPLLDRETGRIQLKGARLENTIGYVVRQAGTQVAIMLSVYGKRLRLDLHFDPSGLTRDEAGELLSYFVDELRHEVAGVGQGS